MTATIRYIGRTLRARRIKAKMSQEEVARAIGITQPTVSKIENGANETSLGNINQMAELYGTTLRAVLLDTPEGLEGRDPAESELISLYHRLSDESRVRILALFRELAAFVPSRLREPTPPPLSRSNPRMKHAERVVPLKGR